MAVAEFERAIIQERVNAGLRAAKARGVKLGRKPTLLQHRETVQRLLREGKGVRAIARECGLPVSSVHKLAKATREETKAGLERRIIIAPGKSLAPL